MLPVQKEPKKKVKFDPSTKKMKVNTHVVTYKVSNHSIRPRGTLIDRGANGGIAGDDVRVVEVSSTPRRVNVAGLADASLKGIPIGTVGQYVETNKGPIIAIYHQMALYLKGKSILSPPQMEHFKIKVSDVSMKVGGLQRIRTPEGYVIPIDIVNGLPEIRGRKYTDDEYDTLPHVTFTSDVEWDPEVVDNIISDKEEWYSNIEALEEGWLKYPFDEFGNYTKREPVVHENYQASVESAERDIIEAQYCCESPLTLTLLEYRN
jgi:hypothetical protein